MTHSQEPARQVQGQVDVVQLDLKRSVHPARTAAADDQQKYGKIDALINQRGHHTAHARSCRNRERFEMQFGTTIWAHFFYSRAC